MKNFILCILVVLATTIELRAQTSDFEKIAKNGLYIEFYTIRHAFSSGLVSINYERIVGNKRKTALRVGAYPDFRSTLSLPVTLTWITSPLKKHHFEYGLGLVFRYERFQGKSYYDMPAAMFPIMYRYQRSRGLFFRGGVNLFYSWPALASPSFCLGYKF